MRYATIAAVIFTVGVFATYLMSSRVNGQARALPIPWQDPRTPISSLPYTITECGSYYLTSCLFSGVDTDGIKVCANDVTIDLMGFTIVGNPSSTMGSGIMATDVENLTVFNGSIRSWPGDGINGSSATESRFERLHVSDNGGHGIRTGVGCVVPDVAFRSSFLPDPIRSGQSSGRVLQGI